MSATVADLNPKTLENAKRQFVELYGSALVMNTYLKIALVLVSLVALGLLGAELPHGRQVRPASSRSSSASTTSAGRRRCSTTPPAYQPQPPELRYFLTQFVVKHFSRLRATVQREYPDSLFFLEPALADATIAAERAEPRHRDVPDQPLRRRGRRRRAERQPERADRRRRSRRR